MDESNLYLKQQQTFSNTCSDDSCSFPSFPWFPDNIRRRKSRLGTHRKQGRVFQDLALNNGDYLSSNKENIFEQCSSDTSPTLPPSLDVEEKESKSSSPSLFNYESRTSPFSFKTDEYFDQKSPILAIPQVLDKKVSPLASSLEESKNLLSPFPSCFVENKIDEVLDELLNEIHPPRELVHPFSPSSSCNKTQITEVNLENSSDDEFLPNKSTREKEAQNVDTEPKKLIGTETHTILSLSQCVKELDTNPKDSSLSNKSQSSCKLESDSPLVNISNDIPAIEKPSVVSSPKQSDEGKIDLSPALDLILKENKLPESSGSNIQPANTPLAQKSATPKPEAHFVEPPAFREFVAPRNSSSKISAVINVKGRSYKVLNVLGTGGSSIVYQVSHPETNELLAVKKVELPENDDDITEGYLNEVQMLESLQNCDVIIKIFDHQLVYKNGDKILYVVMEKGDTDLSSLIRSVNESKKLSIPMIIYYWTEMLAAVNEVHRRGIIHSDLKPANFVLVRGRLKLIDFGIASSIQGDMTSVFKDSFCGTLNYMSPEATSYVRNPAGMAGYKITFKTDVWSLGCILYNLIYGRLPFHHIKKRMDKIFAIVSPTVRVEFPEKKDIPPILMNSLKLCLEKDYTRRPTVQELLDRTMRIFQCSNIE